MSCEILDFLVYDSTTLRSVRLAVHNKRSYDLGLSLERANMGSNPIQTTKWCFSFREIRMLEDKPSYEASHHKLYSSVYSSSGSQSRLTGHLFVSD